MLKCVVVFFISKDVGPHEPLLKNVDDEDTKEKDDRKPTEDLPTEPDSIPLNSFVVQVDSDKGEDKNAESEM